MIIKKFEFNMLPVNTYVLSDEETHEAVVIDAGCYYEQERHELSKYIHNDTLTVKHLLNTHLHFDHIFGNHFMYEEFGLKTEANRADEEWLKEAPSRTRMFGLEFPGEPVSIGTYLNDGDVITFGKYKLQCISVPGHSPGSLVFYCAEENCMFSGDVLFKGSIGRTDLPGGNFDALISGIRTKLFVLPNDTTIYSGHGDITSVGDEKRNNYYLR